MNKETSLYSNVINTASNPKRLIQNAALAIALSMSTAAAIAPINEASASATPVRESSQKMNSASAMCLSLGVFPTGGPVEGTFEMSNHRFYTLFENGVPVRDITNDLLQNPGAVNYDDLDRDGNKVGVQNSVKAAFYDYQISLENGSQPQIMRARYGENQVDTQAYRLEKINGSWENTGSALTFRKDRADGQIKVMNGCGQEEEKGAIMLKKVRLLYGGATREVRNAIVWLADNCTFHDRMITEHYLRAQGQPQQPPREEPRPETPGRRDIPAPVQVPVQLPRTGDGSVPN